MMESARRIEPTLSEDYLKESHLRAVDNVDDDYSPAVFKPNPNRKIEIEPEPAVWRSGRTGESLNAEVPEADKSETAQIYNFPLNEDKNLEINNDNEFDSGLEETDYIEAVEKLRENISVLQGDLIALEESDLSDEEKHQERMNIEADMTADKKVLSAYTIEAIKQQEKFIGSEEVVEETDEEVEPAVWGSNRTPAVFHSNRKRGNDEKVEQIEYVAEEIKEVNKEEQRQEYLRLKGDFKNSQREYYKALEESYSARGPLTKLFGLERDSMAPHVQTAYFAFMEANSQYYKFAQSSGMYQKIAERMNREKGEGEQLSVKPLVADRHVLKPAEQRLELQTLHLPESVLKLKNSLMEKIKANPKTAIGVGGLALGAAAAFNLPGLVAGLATRNVTKWAGDKYIGSKERKLEETKEGMVEGMDGETDLEKMEADYFKGLKDVRTAENYTTAARRVATGLAAFGAGAAYSGSVEAIDAGVNDSIDAQELFNEAGGIDLESMSVPDNTSELMHVVERGDTTSEIINNTIRERLATGELALPKGVGENDISHWLYQSFPELTSASEIQPRLTPSEWMDLGISSGNPQDIKPGEMINVETLLEKMRGMGGPEVQMSGDVNPATIEEAIDSTQDTFNPSVDSQVPEVSVETVASPEISVGVETAEQISSSPDSSVASPDDIKFPSEGGEVHTHYESDQDGVMYQVQEEVLPIKESLTQYNPDVFRPEDFKGLISEIGKIRRFAPGEDLSDHLLDLLDRVPPELKEKYLPDLFTKDPVSGNIVEVDHLEYLRNNLPEVSVHPSTWMSPSALTHEQWQYVGVPSGVPTDLKGAALDHEKLFQVLFNPDSASAPEVVSSAVSPETSAVAGGAVEASSYTPYVSEKLVQQSHQFANPESGSLHKHLAETLLREYRGHSINLPADTAMRVSQNETALYGFIEKHIPDLSTNWFSKTLRGGPDMFTSEDWVNYGIKSGDPTNIASGEVVKTGEIIKKLLEIAGGNVNKI